MLNSQCQTIQMQFILLGLFPPRTNSHHKLYVDKHEPRNTTLPILLCLMPSQHKLHFLRKERFTPSFLLCVFLLEGLCEVSGFASAAINWEAEFCQVKHECQSSVLSNQIIIFLKVIGLSQKYGNLGLPLPLGAG